jgi:hypothetical protein
MVPPLPVWDVCTLSTPKDLTAVYQSILTGLRTPAAPISHLEFSTECLTTCLCLGDKDLWVEYLESRILPPIFAGIPPIASISLRGTSGVAFPVGIFDSHAFRLVSSVEMTNCTFESPQAFRNLLKSFPMATTLVIDGLHWNNDETTPPYQLSNIGAPALTALRFRGITKRNFARTILSGGYLSNVVELLYYSHPDNSQRLAPLAELLVALGPNLGSLGLDILKCLAPPYLILSQLYSRYTS